MQCTVNVVLRIRPYRKLKRWLALGHQRNVTHFEGCRAAVRTVSVLLRPSIAVVHLVRLQLIRTEEHTLLAI